MSASVTMARVGLPWLMLGVILFHSACSQHSHSKNVTSESRDTSTIVSTRAASRKWTSRTDYDKKWLVVIGINDYEPTKTGFRKLDYASADAVAVRDLLELHFGFECPAELSLVNEDPRKADATESNTQSIEKRDVINLFKTLREMPIQPDDVVLLFFAGHGFIDNDDPEKPGYLAAQDSTRSDLTKCIPIARLRDCLADLPCLHKAIILNTCYAGKLFQSAPTAPDHSSVSGINDTMGTLVTQWETSDHTGRNPLGFDLAEPCFFGMSASNSTEALDRSRDGKNTIFTELLLRELLERCDAPGPTHVFRFATLGQRVADKMRGLPPDINEVNQEVTFGPMVGSAQTLGTGKFIFRQSRDVLTPSERAIRTRYNYQLRKVNLLVRQHPSIALTLLEDETLCPPDLRSLSWRLLRDSCSLPYETIQVGKRTVEYICFTPDGGLVTAGALLGPITLWEVGSWSKRGRFELPEEETGRIVDGSRNGSFIGAGSISDNLIRLWKSRDQQRTASISMPQPPSCIAISDDGSLVATGNYFKSAVYLWNAETGEQVRTFTEGQIFDINREAFSVEPLVIRKLSFSPDGKEITIGSNALGGGAGQSVVCDVATGVRRGVIEGANAVYSPFGDLLVCSDAEHPVTSWDAATLTKLRSIDLMCASPNGLAFSPDGTVVAIAGGEAEYGIALWNPLTGGLVGTVPGAASSVAFSPEGGMLACGEVDGRIRVWRRSDWNSITSTKLLNLPAAVSAIAISRRSRVAVASLDRRLRLYDPNKRQGIVTKEHDGIIKALKFSSDGRALAIGTTKGTVRVLEWSSLEELVSLNRHNASVIALGFLEEGNIWTACEDGAIRKWHRETGTFDEVLYSNARPIVAATVTSDGERCAIALDDGSVHVLFRGAEPFDTRTLKAANGVLVLSLAFSVGDGSLAACGEDGFAVRWTMDDAQEEVLLEGYDADEIVWAIDFVDEGRAIVTVGGDATIRLWDPLTGDERGHFEDHIGDVSSMAVSPSGLQIVTGGDDHDVRLWGTGSADRP